MCTNDVCRNGSSFFARQETEAATIYHDPKVDETHREKKRGLTQKK